MSRIPPLPALKAFLAACRAGSYSAAAEELNVTHGAVSRQIQTLEDWLGQKLFERAGQRMAPTSHALAFALEVSEAFERINDAAQRYGKGSASMLLRVSAPATFAMRWLIPRLNDFHKKIPGHVDSGANGDHSTNFLGRQFRLGDPSRLAANRSLQCPGFSR